ncbi:hypothetical protein A3C91_02395 [Candidatus Azambacteria bacterium RIFCSPHIGHO2_02_FULL_52_12]|uniref:Sugar 3,4-ketoisomerase QdtA cupin domain-containing protein n=1 Tax=Candidatus Azambacteria bacterium RIFCSPLOWO2_01_FULL_46_25 TaxID=1797298 RepID=A0A1F5BVP9_9BACT|nr:MAG: hypothetical protein A3C91_02395 [Candidatus Azambacteria bacterium RIFCSPHIGHO2_02_FULL_52_12]OGD34671.1 MAG: hypothetical protein A2988_04190 [Candidatus Azambacteria bacterium RIFCSPLOWO2_01_FULL_46_25]OGD37441.1 MAG: hypothetical protein A2850_02620 [Candidatus Azambacteria bacterium RIFCSPHIGHO2_01_FULL_51_74]
MQALITQTKPVSADHRRTIWEPLNGPGMRRVNFFEFQEALPVGNHFHRYGTELFLVTKGTLRVAVLEDVVNKKRVSVRNLPSGTLISVPVGVSHAFIFEPGSAMIGMASAPFDESDKDLNDYKLLDKEGNELPSPN